MSARYAFLTFAVALFLRCPAHAADVPAQKLVDACENKIPVFQRGTNRKGAQKVGEQIDGFCEGYLMGSYRVLVETSKIHADGDVTAEYLWSVVKIYIKDNPSATSQPAVSVVMSAYSRAFPFPTKK
jgi:hypothetical protein